MTSRAVRYAVAVGAVCVGIVAALLGGLFRGNLEPEETLLGAHREGDELHTLEIAYPFDEAIFPPEIVAPTFRWTDRHAEADTWRITIELPDAKPPMSFLSRGRKWTPTDQQWEAIKSRSLGKEARVTIAGVNQAAPEKILSAASITISTSKDEVGAPLFYREVNLPFIDAVKDPTRIRWRFGPISSPEQPPVVLEKLPVCGNCHSFSADASILGMDVDYANDKGSYAITPVGKEIVLGKGKIITWNDYQKEDRVPTFGLLSQVSPDGRYVISTVKDRSVFVAKPGLEFSQLFFPIKGILAFYDRQTRTFHALPGADDKQFVQSNPTWSPDGKYIVFARSKAHHLEKESSEEKVLLTSEECREFLVGGKTFLFDLYRIPFNGGQGGQPEPLEGASNNGMSNYFPKYSPDGKWIVFCKAQSFMLLQPDSELYIMPAAGGPARRMRCNTTRMNSWHSWSPNGRWLVFSSKANGPYTQLFLTHIDEEGRSSPPVVLSRFTSPDRAANIPEFVNAKPDAIAAVRQRFVDEYSFIRAAREYHRAGDPDGATRLYEKVLELDPKSAEAHTYLGHDLMRKGMIEEAKAHFTKAIEYQPSYSSAHSKLGSALCSQRRWKEAIEHFKKAIEVNPEQADTQNNWGNALVELGEFDEAIEHFKKAIEIDPEEVSSYRNLGSVLANLGEFQQAIEHYRKVLEIDPQDDWAHYSWATALISLGKPNQAIEHYRRTIEINPKHAPAYHNWGSVLANLGEFEQAIECYQKALEINPQRDSSHYTWGNALQGLGRLDQSAEHYRKAIEINPKHALAHNNLGQVLAQGGKFGQALEHFRKAVEINPNHVLAHKNLAVLFSRQGEVDQAIAHLQKAVEISPNDLGAINDLAWLLATCPREDLRDGARAVELAERACQATGHKVPELMDTLAAAYAEAGRFSQAVATAEKSLGLIQPDQESVAERIRQRLELYQAGKPYHTQH